MSALYRLPRRLERTLLHKYQHFQLFRSARRLVAGARDVFRVAAAVLVDAVGRQLQHAVRQRGQEVPVVFDDRRCL